MTPKTATKQDLILQQECRQKNTPRIQSQVSRRCKVSIQKNSQARDMVCSQMKSRYQALKTALDKALTVPKIKHLLKNVIHPAPTIKKSELLDILLGQLRRCKNEHTLIEMTNVADIPPQQLYITSEHYCHNIHELLDYMISTHGTNVDPSDPTNSTTIWKNDSERDGIVKDHRVSKESREAWFRMLDKALQQQKQILLSMDFWDAMETIGKLGFILMNDEPASHSHFGFHISTNAIAYFTKYLEKFSKKDQDKIWKVRPPKTSSTLSSILGDAAMCVHAKGTHLIKIYFHYFEMFHAKFPTLSLLPIFTFKSPRYAVHQFVGKNDFVKITLQASKTNSRILVYEMLFEKTTAGNIKSVDRSVKTKPLSEAQLEFIENLISEFDLV
jgi:hypothetical protein